MKQYLLLCDEVGMQMLGNLFRSECVKFLEVQGMGVASGNAVSILVTPVLPPVTPMPLQPPVEVMQNDSPAEPQV